MDSLREEVAKALEARVLADAGFDPGKCADAALAAVAEWLRAKAESANDYDREFQGRLADELEAKP